MNIYFMKSYSEQQFQAKHKIFDDMLHETPSITDTIYYFTTLFHDYI